MSNVTNIRPQWVIECDKEIRQRFEGVFKEVAKDKGIEPEEIFFTDIILEADKLRERADAKEIPNTCKFMERIENGLNIYENYVQDALCQLTTPEQRRSLFSSVE